MPSSSSETKAVKPKATGASNLCVSYVLDTHSKVKAVEMNKNDAKTQQQHCQHHEAA
jgi:hypothetical protein